MSDAQPSIDALKAALATAEQTVAGLKAQLAQHETAGSLTDQQAADLATVASALTNLGK